jgi:hypothetical protein
VREASIKEPRQLELLRFQFIQHYTLAHDVDEERPSARKLKVGVRHRMDRQSYRSGDHMGYIVGPVQMILGLAPVFGFVGSS